MFHNYSNMITDAALNSGENRLVEWGNRRSTTTILNTMHYNWFNFYGITEKVATLTIEVSIVPDFATVETLHTLPLAAATVFSSYNLPPPVNNNGHVAVTFPYMRVRLQDAATAVHAYTRFWLKIWE